MTASEWVEVFKAGVWPATVLIIIFYFRHLIADLLKNRLKSAKLGPGELEFAVAEAGELVGVKKDEAVESIDWTRTGALFWFTSDIMNAIGAVSSGRDTLMILNLIDRTLNHATQLNFDQVILDTLRRIRHLVSTSSDAEWIDRRSHMVTELSRVFNSVSDLAKAHENRTSKTKFKADPDVPS